MPKINHEILTWARESSGLSVGNAAKKLQLKDTQTATGAEKLLAFENGKAPSRALLVRMAKQYRKPLLAFYMEKQPRTGTRGDDFRTLPDDFTPEDDVFVDVLIRDIVARQSILRETLIEEDEAETLPFIGSANIQQGAFQVANTISQTLNFQLEEFRRARTADHAFKYLRTIAEKMGIFVLLAGNLGSHHSNIDTKVFRGFVLADKVAPFVIINDQDAKSAWSFTLLHEITHLWLGQTGVSGSFAENRIEKFCNDVASKILLPADDLRDFNPDVMDFDNLTQEISDFAQTRNISNGLVSYRLLRQNSIDQKTWFKLSRHFKDQWMAHKAKQRERGRKQDGGPSYYIVRRNKLGASLVQFAERMTYSGALTTTKAGLLLGVKPLKVHKLFNAGRAI